MKFLCVACDQPMKRKVVSTSTPMHRTVIL
jgi:hypothetical protein